MVAIPAAGVAEVIEEAGRMGCGGAVVYSAGFAEVAKIEDQVKDGRRQSSPDDAGLLEGSP